MVAGERIPDVTSSKVRNICDSVDKFMGANDEEIIARFRKLCETFDPVEDITRDTLKGARLAQAARENALRVRRRC